MKIYQTNGKQLKVAGIRKLCIYVFVSAAVSVNKVNVDMGQGRAGDILTETGNASASSAALCHKHTLKAKSSENTICQAHPK